MRDVNQLIRDWIGVGTGCHMSGYRADRTAELRNVTAPTLVIHGDRDLIVHPSGGRATAAAIPGARHISIAGMGHGLAPAVTGRLVDLVTQHARASAQISQLS